MNDNIVVAHFREGSRVTVATSRWQWDYGQRMIFEGLTLPEQYEVHFGPEFGPTTITQIGTADGVSIPDELLESGQYIHAWVFLHTGNDDGETIYAVTIPVKKRQKPSNDVPTPTEQSAISEAIELLNTNAHIAEGWAVGEQDGQPVYDGPYYENNAKYFAKQAEDSAVDAETYAADAESYKDDAEGSASAAENARTEAETAQEAATGYAADASGYSQAAKNYRDQANSAKNQAMSSAQTASDKASAAGISALEAAGSASAASGSASAAATAASHYPYIGTNKNWFVWNVTEGAYVDTGVKAEGHDGEPGTGVEVHICTSAEYDPTTHVPTVQNPEENTFYLVPAEDGTAPDMFVEWIYTNNAWELFGSGKVEVPVTDVQVNGVSVLSQGVANVPVADGNVVGVVGVNPSYGIGIYNDNLIINGASADNIKAGNNSARPISPFRQHESTFYGLAKAAGHDEKNSTEAFGTYTESAKSAISEMLGGSVAVSGSTPVIAAKPGVRYVCGEVSTLGITTPATGIIDVVFESGSTATVLTVTPPTGNTVKWPAWFDPNALEANTTYELSVMDGVLVGVMQW